MKNITHYNQFCPAIGAGIEWSAARRGSLFAATVTRAESNGAGETVTDPITNSNMGSTDAPNLDPVAYPVTPGNNTYEKWQRFHVTAMGGSSSIQNLKFWRTGSLGANASHKTNARESGYAGAATYATPVATASSVADQTVPTSQPSGANFGIGGALDGSLTDVGYSDYIVHQIQTTGAAVAGSTTTLNYQYDEVA